MKQLLDIVPVILFFAAYKFYDIYVATAVLMAATAVQMGVIWLMDRRLETMHKVTLVLILVFGSLTLALRDESFIKWKPTVLYSAMALTLGVAYWGLRKNFLKLMLDKHLTLPDRVWGHLTVAWIGYALFMAAVNGYVAVFFSTEFWVNFKLWGYVFPLVFLVGQALYLSRYMKSDEASKS